MTEALYTHNAYNILYVTGETVQALWPRMGATFRKRTSNLSEMSFPILESGAGEKVMPPPKDPEKYALYIQRQSEARKGKPCPEHVKERLSILYKGREFSEETRAKIGAKHKGKIIPPEQRAQISAKLTGRKASDETKKKLSEIRKGKPHSEEWVKKISMAQKGKPRPKLPDDVEAERRRKISQSMQGCNAPSWKGGISFEPYCEKFTREFKERVREFFGRTCVECGTPENGQKLDVHHVNFDKSSCCSDAAPLFVALCRTCHMKTNYNRDYWENHFTEIIMTQFNGKCYIPKDALKTEQITKEG